MVGVAVLLPADTVWRLLIGPRGAIGARVFQRIVQTGQIGLIGQHGVAALTALPARRTILPRRRDL